MFSPMELNELLPQRTLPEGLSEAAFFEDIQAQIVKDFEWDVERITSASVGVLQLLTDEITWGLERDPNPIFAAFYRLDLGESTVRHVLHEKGREFAAPELAKLALQRAAQKVWTRWTYRSLT